MTKSKQELRKDFNRLLTPHVGEINNEMVFFDPIQLQDKLWKWFKQSIQSVQEEERQRVVDPVLTILDKAELEDWFDMPNTTENWKTWKRIRNTISDFPSQKEIKDGQRDGKNMIACVGGKDAK